MAKKSGYSDNDIEMLEGADRVRKRPAVIFGSNGIAGCEHSVFEILVERLVVNFRKNITASCHQYAVGAKGIGIQSFYKLQNFF